MYVKILLKQLVMQLISLLLTKQNFQAFGDKFFDMLEEMIENTSTTYDDVVLLPIIRQLRSLLNIEDLPDSDKAEIQLE